MTDSECIEGCLAGSRRHQRVLYERYAPKMMGVCMRYAGSEAEAEDILQEGFVTVFRKIGQYAERGALGAWIRKVMLNTALMAYRKNRHQQLNVVLEDVEFALESGEDVFRKVALQDLMYMIQQLPAGYRVVFNLYAVEGYNHREIAEKLGISAGTSKSQYSRARAMLKRMIETEEKKVNEQAI